VFIIIIIIIIINIIINIIIIIIIFEVKTCLCALSKIVVGIELDWHVTLGTVILVRVKSARVTAIWIGDRYMRWMKLFVSITENNFIDWYTLHYQV
jgi:hypothetical protein